MKPKKEKRLNVTSTVVQGALCVASILLGGLLTFVPHMDPHTLCSLLCVLMLVGGVVAIGYFFLSGAHREPETYNYSFALGVMLLILGCCGFARIDQMAGAFMTYMGFLILIMGVVSLQNTVQLRLLNNSLWVVVLVLTLIILTGSVLTLLDITKVWELFHYWLLLLCGILGLCSIVLTMLALRHSAKASIPGQNTRQEARTELQAESGPED